MKGIKNAGHVLTLAGDRASYWLAVLARDGEVLVHRTGILQDRWVLEENCRAAVAEVEAAARDGRIVFRLPPYEAGRDGLMSRPWAIWCGLPPAEKNRLMAIEATARDAKKPAFPGWADYPIPADLYESAQWGYEGNVVAALLAAARKVYRDVPEDVPEGVIALARSAHDAGLKADVEYASAVAEVAAAIPKVDVGDWD